jgi:tetratricopeptide (TPR) repeat protein
MRGFTLPDKQPREGSTEAVEILRDLLNKAPDHPGVHHYVIHAIEGSTIAKDAWPSCRRYPELVTNIPHALHMPGHIYAQTGRWDDAVNSFAVAADNERGYMRADKLYGKGHHGHNVHFLATAYSFRGDYGKAKDAATELLGLGENPREAASIDGFYDAYRQGWFAMMRTLVQGELWDEILDGKTLPVYDKPREQAWRHWAMAQAYAAKGRFQLAVAESKLMDASLREYKSKVKMPVPDVLEVARLELEGRLKIAGGQKTVGFAKLSEAADRELHLLYTEPPGYPRPVFEVLGEEELKSGRTDQAVAAFKRALEQYPESHRAVVGLRAAGQNGAVAGN